MKLYSFRELKYIINKTKTAIGDGVLIFKSKINYLLLLKGVVKHLKLWWHNKLRLTVYGRQGWAAGVAGLMIHLTNSVVFPMIDSIEWIQVDFAVERWVLEIVRCNGETSLRCGSAHFSPSPQECPHLRSTRKREWSLSFLSYNTLVGVTTQQQFNNVNMTPFASPVQWCPEIIPWIRIVQY